MFHVAELERVLKKLLSLHSANAYLWIDLGQLYVKQCTVEIQPIAVSKDCSVTESFGEAKVALDSYASGKTVDSYEKKNIKMISVGCNCAENSVSTNLEDLVCSSNVFDNIPKLNSGETQCSSDKNNANTDKKQCSCDKNTVSTGKKQCISDTNTASTDVYERHVPENDCSHPIMSNNLPSHQLKALMCFLVARYDLSHICTVLKHR